MLRMRSAFGSALQRLLARRSRPVLLLDRTSETRECSDSAESGNMLLLTYYDPGRSGSPTSQSAVR